MAVDPIAALVTYLKAQSAITTLAGQRVFGGELPRNETPSMPRAAVVVSPAGGGLLGLATLKSSDLRVDVDCYGATANQAWTLYLACYEALKALSGEVRSGVLLHWAKPSAKGNLGRASDNLDWPLTLSSWQVFASEEAAA